jgi:two-component system phosphate regulon response regulator PhoB
VSGAPTAGGRILVVDDDNAIRETLRAILEDEGYAVTVAANGREALLRLQESAVPPDLCIVDMVMPVLNGWELCAELARRPALARMPVLLVSANSKADGPEVGLDTVQVMRKPIDFDRLLEHVERYCRAERG